MVNHVYGNTKIKILKNFKKLIEGSILFFLSFFYKFHKNQKIIISSAMYAPWKDDEKFYNLFSQLKDLTIIDEARAYTLWHLSKSLKNTDKIVSYKMHLCHSCFGFVFSCMTNQ